MCPARSCLACLMLALPVLGRADGQWVLQQSTLSYHMSHPMHQVDGVSHAAKGKGVCHAGTCDFLIAAPVNSFDSGDSNRDLHMIQVTRGAQFPMVSVRFRLAQVNLNSPSSGLRPRSAVRRQRRVLRTCALPEDDQRRRRTTSPALFPPRFAISRSIRHRSSQFPSRTTFPFASTWCGTRCSRRLLHDERQIDVAGKPYAGRGDDDVIGPAWRWSRACSAAA